MSDLRMNDLPDRLDDGTVYDDHGQVPPASVVVLHNNLIKALHRAYPTFKDTWLIRVDTRGGIVQIYNQAFSGQMGFVLHIVDIDPEMKKVREMAGELFERYGIATRRGLSIKQAMQDMKCDPFGRPIYEK
jgi:hypothetical protein